MIIFENVTKKYGDFKALDNLNLKIEDGEVFGLIGHNGAGKSTTIKSLVGIIEAEYGNIFVDGQLFKENKFEIKSKMAYVSDSPDKFLKMETELFWKFMTTIYGIDEEESKKRIDKLCEIFSMQEACQKSIEELSHGMRQKAFVIGALLSNPKIWVLDEPLTGLDPQAAYNLKEMMREHAKKGNIVLFSTHVLEIAQQICDRIGILKEGKLIFCGSMQDLKNKYSGDSLEDIYLEMVNSENSNKKEDEIK